MFHSIDHSLLSPSGRMSKRAREAAIRRESAKLFPAGFWDSPKKTEGQVRLEKAESLLRAAKDLRDLAFRGMQSRKLTKAAEKMEAEAAQLCPAGPLPQGTLSLGGPI